MKRAESRCPEGLIRQENLLTEKFERIREVGESSEGYIYFSTSNKY